MANTDRGCRQRRCNEAVAKRTAHGRQACRAERARMRAALRAIIQVASAPSALPGFNRIDELANEALKRPGGMT